MLQMKVQFGTGAYVIPWTIDGGGCLWSYQTYEVLKIDPMTIFRHVNHMS